MDRRENEVESATIDYRSSHLEKGQDYDSELSRGDFETYMTERELQILSRIVPRLFPRGIPRYMDFACGTGRITEVMETMADASCAVDVSSAMIEQARGKCPRTTFFLRDLTEDASGIERVDVVTAFRFFGNAEDPLRRAALRAIHSLLRDGGYLIVNNHRNPRSVNNLLLRARGTRLAEDLDHGKFRGLLRDAGFEIEQTYGIGWWVILGRLDRPRVLSSALARILEPLSRLPGIGPFCPDLITVARRVG